MSGACLVPLIDDDLAWTPRPAHAERLRADMLGIVDATIAAAAPGPLVTRALEARPLEAARIMIVAAGKAAPAMAAAAVAALRGSSVHGVVIAPAPTGTLPADDQAVHPLQTMYGDHPLPSYASKAAARQVMDLLAGTSADDIVLLLLSGGASALLALPAGDISIEDYAATTQLLLKSGADIEQINTVRRHIDALKGGRLALLAAPAPVHALILSDVIGDKLDAIASGPVTPDRTTYADAIATLHAVNAWGGTPERVRRHLEDGARQAHPGDASPDHAAFAAVDARVVGNNALALIGAADAARAAGYAPVMVDAPITGEARTAGTAFVRSIRALASDAEHADYGRLALIGGGETTVHVTGSGRGGRNQELVLAAALALQGTPDILVGSFGTDGIDGTTSVAGAVADGDSVRLAASRGADARASLEDNDAFGFFGGLHDLILTGATGTNVLDVQIALIDRAAD